MRKFIYKKRQTGVNTYTIERWAINPNGIGYTDIGFVEETDIDYKNYINEGNTPEQQPAKFDDFALLKERKKIQIDNETTEAIFNTELAGRKLTIIHQINASLGIYGETFKTEVANIIQAAREKNVLKKNAVKFLNWEAAKNDNERFELIARLNEL